MKKIVWMFVAVFSILLTSCSNDDYLNAIPGESTALISLDVKKIADNANSENKNVLSSILHVDDVSDCGIDMSKKLFLFEAPDGNLGLCAKIDDSDDLNDWLNGALAKSGVCQKTVERGGYHFTVINDSWVVGFSDDAMLVMGPAIKTVQPELQRQIIQYLSAEEDDGIKGKPIYNRLDSISTPIAMVAQAQALPEKFVAPFTLGAPKGSDPSQVYIAAEITPKDGCLNIVGETFSYNKTVDKALKNASKSYRKMNGKYFKSMPNDAMMGIFMNVDGNKFIELLRSNKALQAMLAGINAAIDMDNIIKSVNGDMAIIIPSYSTDKLNIGMAAQLGKRDFLGDVDYWKKSCPKGGVIADWGKDAYYYKNGSTVFYFGVSGDNQFYSGCNASAASCSITASNKPLPANVIKNLSGKKMCMVLNLSTIAGGKNNMNAITSFLKPIFGNVNTVVYSLK
jgi:hypothetical protein